MWEGAGPVLQGSESCENVEEIQVLHSLAQDLDILFLEGRSFPSPPGHQQAPSVWNSRGLGPRAVQRMPVCGRK